MNVESLQHLQVSLERIDELIRLAVKRAQAAGHDPTDSLRGLIVSDDQVADDLQRTPLAGLWLDDQHTAAILPPTWEDSDLPFLHLVSMFNLTVLDSYILLLCLAPEFDRRYERLYAYLQDNVSLRRPTVNLMMNLLGNDVSQRYSVWERLQPDKPLRNHRLVECLPDPAHVNPVFLAYHLKVDHRVVSYLLGDDQPDERLEYAVTVESAHMAALIPEELMAPIRAAMAEAPMVYLHGKKEMGQCELAAVVCAEFGLPLVRVDLERLRAQATPFSLTWRLALREAYLRDTAVLFDGWEHILDDERQPPAELWSALLAYERPVFISGEEAWEPLDIDRDRRLLRVTFTIPGFSERQRAWVQFAHNGGANVAVEDLEELSSKFRFTRRQIARAVQTASDIAHSRGDSASAADLYSGAQAHASLKLGHLAKRIVPRFTWDDLILPPDQLAQLHEITARASFGHVVQDEWGFGDKIGHTQGVSALFSGESGTGKTLAAEVIASDLGLVLYKIDLSAVVSKYIGETEKNLSVIFSEAQSSNAILFFDEADALFGKRSEVKDARDRYANIEIAYLLQQIETYDGIAIMATNLRQNLDEAFTRRLDFLVDFPFPDAQYRERIWVAHFPAEAPLASEVNLGQIAIQYHLAGGNIRNVAVAAAYLAAADGGMISLPHIRNAIRREHQKMGRLLQDE